VLVLLAVGTIRREGDWHDTDRLFSDAIEKEPRSYQALEKVAALRFAQGREAMGRMAEIQARMQRTVEGIRRATVGRRPDEARRLRIEAERLNALGQESANTARRRLEESVELAERTIEAAEGLRDRGQAKLEEIVVKGHWNRYNALVDLERYDDAEAALDEYEADWPVDWHVPFFRGGVDHRRATEVHGRWEAAKRAGRRREAEEHRAARDTLLRAAVQDYLAAVEKAEDADAGAAVVHHNLGLAYRLLDGPSSPRALEQLEAAVARDPDLTVAWDELSRTLSQAGRLDEVLRTWGPGWLELVADFFAYLGRDVEANQIRERARRIR
jgi:tetratricopeptide (TPR) repeat protein